MTVIQDYKIRRANPKDGAEFLCLVTELAVFEKLDPPTPEARSRLLLDAFAPLPKFELWVADDPGGMGLAGYAIVLQTYSSFEAAPTLYIEDVYVTPDMRGTGLSQAFLRRISQEALRRGCARIEGVVLNWNERARAFYAKTGAQEKADWTLFRYDKEALVRMAQDPPIQRTRAKTPQNV